MGVRGPVPKRDGQRRRRNAGPDVTSAAAGSRSVREDEPPRSGKGSTTEAWLTYARSVGHDVEVGVSRSELIALVDEGVPDGDVHGWHPVARGWYESLARSGQSVFYEPSDWATARVVAEAMSRELNPQPIGVDGDGVMVTAEMPPKGASMAAWLKAMTALLVTEGDRRRVQVELHAEKATREDSASADVDDLAAYRDRRYTG